MTFICTFAEYTGAFTGAVFVHSENFIKKKIPPCPLTGGIFHVKVKAVIRLTEVEMTTGSIA